MLLGLIRRFRLLLRLALLASLIRRLRWRAIRRVPDRITLILCCLLRVPDLKVVVNLAYAIYARRDGTEPARQIDGTTARDRAASATPRLSERERDDPQMKSPQHSAGA